MAVARTGGRVVLLDPADRVLLIHERIETGTHWLTPGGGVEAGEHPRAAAERELMEETGIAVDLAGRDAVLVTRRTWSWAGVDYDQTDHFFLTRAPADAEPAPRALTEMERQTWLGFRWWTPAELARTEAVLVPPDLARVLARLLADGVP